MVEAVLSGRAHPALGIRFRPWCPHRCADGPDALGAQYFVEAGGELGVVVVDQEVGAAARLLESKTRLRAIWAIQPRSGLVVLPSRRTSAAPDLDHEQAVEALPEGGVDVGEVGRQHARRLEGGDALAALAKAPTSQAGRALSLSAIEAALHRGGRQRNLERRAKEVRQALRSEQLALPEGAVAAYGAVVSSAVAVVGEMNLQLARLEEELASHLDAHPGAEIIRSRPGLGTVLGARVLGEFGEDPNRCVDAKARKNYAGTSPITDGSGKHRSVKARWVGNDHLKDACYLWAFAALTASPGARRYYDALRGRGKGHDAGSRTLANRLVGILDGCLRHRCTYDEQVAWATPSQEDRVGRNAATTDKPSHFESN